MRRRLLETFYRLAASGLVPRGLVARDLPDPADLRALASGSDPDERQLSIEIVSHCWRYHHLLEYQLSSLVLHPPTRVEITMTVFYSPEDAETGRVLEFFRQQEVPLVRWNPVPVPREQLFRRAIGRDLAAEATRADWLWYSDCDVVFHEGALDRAAAVLEGRDDVLVFPREHHVTDLLEPEHPMLEDDRHEPRRVEIDTGQFHPEIRDRAVGGFQIVHGDVARAVGYCRQIPFYQEPLPHWQKTYEDRTFRWILGTQGTALDLPGLYRIRHLAKGRKASERARAEG